MSITSGRGTTPSGESPLDRRLCAEVGADLARVRASRALSVAQVSETLLLSPRQVKALEEVEFTAFHNATFHVNALRKYAKFAGLDLARVDAIAVAVPAPQASALTVALDEPVDRSHRGLAVVLSGVALAVAVAGAGYLLWGRQASVATPVTQVAAPAPPTPVAVPEPPPETPPPADVPPVPEPATAAATTPVASPLPGATSPIDMSGFGSLKVLHPTWVFVRDADNVVTERSLAQGESLTLESQPTYLAAGSPEVELVVAGHRVDLTRFVSNGQVRMRAGDFDALVQGATPIPAPSAANRP